jgi:hypothetical protein
MPDLADMTWSGTRWSLAARAAGLLVKSRLVINAFVEKLRFLSVPVFKRLTP